MFRILVLVVVVALGALAGRSWAEPFWGARESKPADTDPATLAPGEFIWEGGAVTIGPLVVVVSVPEERAYVYRNGVRIGVTTVSTGRPGHDTPTGVFHVLQKDRDHRSKKYNDAPMPDAERLTWDGVALHAGGLPGYPSSHGCVHLPSRFAELLFDVSSLGMTVVVAGSGKAPQEVADPGAIAPVDASTGQDDVEPRLATDQDYRWEPERSPSGVVSIVASRADARVVVLRNGVEIGRAKLAIDTPEQKVGTHAFVMLDPKTTQPGVAAEGGASRRWISVGLPGYAGQDALLDPALAARLHMPPAFRSSLNGVLSPGATLLITDQPVLEQTTGQSLRVLDADPSSDG
jgi:hypothetical protein